MYVAAQYREFPDVPQAASPQQDTKAAGSASAPASEGPVPARQRTTLYGSVMNRLRISQAVAGSRPCSPPSAICC
jgi:hypothetical protein